MSRHKFLEADVEGEPPTITSHINGHFITKYTSDKKFDDILSDRGSIALQVHGGNGWPNGANVRFRNFQVNELW